MIDVYSINMTTSTTETWKIHHIFDLYMGSTEGRIMHIKTGNILKASLRDGYVYVSVRGSSMQKKKPLMSIVLFTVAFILNGIYHPISK